MIERWRPSKAGLAWHYKFYSDNKRLADDEDNARLKKLGLWGGSHKPIAPWDWRKLSKDERDEFRSNANMKNLLRMSLFIIARAGLCLSVVAWVMGQWWTGTVHVIGDGRSLRVDTARSIFFHMVSFGSSPMPTVEFDLMPGPLVWELGNDNSEGVTFVQLPGLCVEFDNDGEWLLGQLRHWLTITLFVLFYGVLKWVYRKRGKAAEPEP